MEPDNTTSKPVSSKKSIALTILLILVVLISSLFYIYPFFKNFQAESTIPVDTIPINQIIDKSIPQDIPKDIVSEKNIEVVQSYTATVDGKQQSTYQYLSSTPLKDIVKSFDAYVTKNNWGIYNKQDLPNGFNYLYINQESSMLTLSSVLSTDQTKHLITITLIKKI